MIRGMQAFVICIVFLSGCAIAPTPQNTKEYRAAVVKDGGKQTAVNKYKVKRPYYEVVKTVKKKIRQCVDKKVIERKVCGGPYGSGCNTQTMTFNASFKQGKKQSELAVQMDMTKSIILGGGPPKGGMYIAVIDIMNAGKNATVIQEYAPQGRKYFRKIPNAVKHWAARTNMGCPDLAGSIYE